MEDIVNLNIYQGIFKFLRAWLLLAVPENCSPQGQTRDYQTRLPCSLVVHRNWRSTSNSIVKIARSSSVTPAAHEVSTISVTRDASQVGRLATVGLLPTARRYISTAAGCVPARRNQYLALSKSPSMR